MSDNIIEKKFLCLILLSVIIHAVAFFTLMNISQENKTPAVEPLMVDLDGIPPFVSPPSPAAPPVRRHSEERQRVEREVAPRGDDPREKSAGLLESRQKTAPLAPAPKDGQKGAVVPKMPVDQAGRERSPRDELFRKKGQPRLPETTDLYPGAAKMARIEEGYRKKFGPEVADGETRFLNTDDIQFGSFLRRFENSVYGVWRYPAEAAKMGIEGITPVKITFNRHGEIVGRELLQSSGSKILDTEVLRTLDQIGPVGAFPKGYEKETYSLIVFFYYGIMQGARRSLR